MPKDTKPKRSPEPEPAWNPEQFVDDAERFKALGDPTRLAVIGFLLDWKKSAKPLADAESSGATVTEITQALTGKTGKEPSALSHHLKELLHTGLVAMTRNGKNRCYRVDTDVLCMLCGGLSRPPCEIKETKTATPTDLFADREPVK